MDDKELGSIKGWFAGRLPDGWFTGEEGAAAGRIARFREETRGQRIGIAREAEERFKKYVTWGAKLDGVTKRFNPGGGGMGRGDDRRSVMIRRWMRRHRGRHAQEAQAQSQAF